MSVDETSQKAKSKRDGNVDASEVIAIPVKKLHVCSSKAALANLINAKVLLLLSKYHLLLQ